MQAHTDKKLGWILQTNSKLVVRLRLTSNYMSTKSAHWFQWPTFGGLVSLNQWWSIPARWLTVSMDRIFCMIRSLHLSLGDFGKRVICGNPATHSPIYLKSSSGLEMWSWGIRQGYSIGQCVSVKLLFAFVILGGKNGNGTQSCPHP